MFITYFFNSLPHVEYDGAILVIKDKLRKEEVDLPEVEQILEDKYQSMKHVKGWDDEEDDYALFTRPSNKKKYKKQFKGRCAYCGKYGHKAVDCPNKKSNENKGFKRRSNQKKKHSTKGEHEGKGHKDMSKIKCYNWGEYGHYACDCPKPCDNANIAKENEQNKGFENMMDLDNSSVNKECAVLCMDIYYEDGDNDIIMYRTQGVSTEEHGKATYGKLTKIESEEEEEVNYNMALCANNSVSLEKKEGDLMRICLTNNVYNVSQSNVSINENTTVNSFDSKVTTVQGPMDDNNEIKSWKACTMEMP